jgi:hypothetical protein
MSFIRARQRSITALFPQPGNTRFLVPKRGDALSPEARKALGFIPNATPAEKAAVAAFVDYLVANNIWALMDEVGICCLSDITDASTGIVVGTLATPGVAENGFHRAA